MLAPIVLFVYNRPQHTQKLLESLANNQLASDSTLYVYCDGPKNINDEVLLDKVREVRQLVKSVSGFQNVIVKESDTNLGLANSVIKGVTEVLNIHERIIVLEDDLELSTGFLKYMNEALEMYAAEEKVMQVSGYWYPIKSQLPATFFLTLAPSWGWATWKRAWSHFEPSAEVLLEKFKANNQQKKFDYNYTFNFYRMLKKCAAKQNDSWAIRWYASLFFQNGLCLIPNLSYVDNTGHDNSGIHSQATNVFKNNILNTNIEINSISIIENSAARKLLERFFISAKIMMIPVLLKDKVKNMLKALF